MLFLLPLPRPVVWLFAVVVLAVVVLLVAAALADSAEAATGFRHIFGLRRPV